MDVFATSRHQTQDAKNRTNRPKWITENAVLVAVEEFTSICNIQVPCLVYAMMQV